MNRLSMMLVVQPKESNVIHQRTKRMSGLSESAPYDTNSLFGCSAITSHDTSLTRKTRKPVKASRCCKAKTDVFPFCFGCDSAVGNCCDAILLLANCCNMIPSLATAVI